PRRSHHRHGLHAAARLAVPALLLAPSPPRPHRHRRRCRLPPRLGLRGHRARHLPPRRQPHRHRHRARPRTAPRRTRVPHLPRHLHRGRLHRGDPAARDSQRAEVAVTYLAITIPFLALALAVALVAPIR